MTYAEEIYISEEERIRVAQNERDHEFLVKKLNHEILKNIIDTTVCVTGIIAGLFLLLAKGDSAVGTPLCVACFMALIIGR